MLAGWKSGDCEFCKHWNTDNVTRVEDKPSQKASECIQDGTKFINFYYKNKFCNLKCAHVKHRHRYIHCEQFDLTEKQSRRELYLGFEKETRNYLTRLKHIRTLLKTRKEPIKRIRKDST